MRLIIILFLAFAILLLNSCKDSSTNPPQISPISVLTDMHFENQEQPSLVGLEYGYPIWGIRKTSISFSNDVPSNGGQWSLKLFPPDSFYSVMRFVIQPEQPSQSKQFRLMYRYKSYLNSSCDIIFEAWNGSNGYDNSKMVNDSLKWTQDTLIFHSNNLIIDRLVVYISLSAPTNNLDTTKFILFNEFKVEEY